jgi:hypothetical protein
MLLCPNCRGWRRHADDRFCGHCGYSFIILSASAAPQFTYAGDSGLRSFALVLRNEGAVDPSGATVSVRDRSDGRILFSEALAAGTLAMAGDNVAHDVALPPSLTGRRWRGLVELSIPGQEERRVLAELEHGLPVPVLTIEAVPGMTELHPDGSATAGARLILTAGERAPVERITVDDAFHGIAVVAPDEPALLTAGKTLDIRLKLSGDAVQTLRASPAGRRIGLQLRLSGRPAPTALSLPLRFETPPQPALTIPKRLAALTGRTLRVPVGLSNLGGTPFELCRMSIRLDTDGDAIEHTEAVDGADAQVMPGESVRRCLELRLARPSGAALPARSHIAEVTLHFGGERLVPVSQRITVDVRPVKPFEGHIAIDFGTSETAVSYQRLGGSEPPRTLALGRTRDFVPTTIAYAMSSKDSPALEPVIGEEACALAESVDAGVMVFFDNLKWRLGSQEAVPLPDGQVTTWTAIAADYLRLLKARIEEHPDIAASIDRVYPTRPARFGALATAELAAAFGQAGMTALGVPSSGDRDTLISESWSPMVLVPPLPVLDGIRALAVGGEKLLGDAVPAKHHVITYDVGGGSTDISLFVVDIIDRATIAVREVASDGSTKLCGNRVAAMLYAHLAPSLDIWLSRHGVARHRLSVHLPWEEIPADGIDPLAGRNGRCLARLLSALQNGGSSTESTPFRRLLQRFKADHKTSVPLDPSDAAVAAWMEKHRGEILALEPPHDGPLTLTTDDGEALEIPWGGDGLSLDLAGFLTDFRKGIDEPLREVLAGILANEPADGAIPLHQLVSGRGSLFPLIRDMLDRHLSEILGNRKVAAHRIAVDCLKRITGEGALYLADLMLNSTKLTFRSDASMLFGVLGDLDERTGLRRFLKLFDGYPTPEAGLRAVPRPLPPGNLDRRIELGIGSREGDVAEARFRSEFSFSRRVNLTRQQADNLHIMVEMTADERLVVSIGWPGQSGRDDPMAFEREVMGTVSLGHAPEGSGGQRQ